MPHSLLNLYKEIGETPLERLNRFRIENVTYKNAVLSYAGRLDPLAEGVLPILVGEQNKDQKSHFALSKEYEVEVLFGFSTDTYDILGLPKKGNEDFDLDMIPPSIESLIGEREEEYPPYSSKNVLGKPLFYYARNNKLDEIVIPKRKIKIESIEILKISKIPRAELLEEITRRVGLVRGDFRQEEIVSSWRKLINGAILNDFDILRLKVTCGEGAYMRTLAHKLGFLLNTSAIAFSIKRTKVGDLFIEDSIRWKC